jgi:hypothetical protein
MKILMQLIRILVIGFLAIVAQPGYGETRIEARHVIMLHPGFDTVWGTYMFGVRNDGTEPEKLRGFLTLPKETADFQAQEGLTQEELISGGADGLMFEKEFPAGLTLISIGFKVNANFGSTVLTFAPKVDLQDFSVVTKKDPLTIKSSSGLLNEPGITPVSNEDFVAITAKGPIHTGESVVIEVGNVPEGRGRLWIAGGIIAGLIATFSLGLTLKTLASSRPPEKIEVA